MGCVEYKFPESDCGDIFASPSILTILGGMLIING